MSASLRLAYALIAGSEFLELGGVFETGNSRRCHLISWLSSDVRSNGPRKRIGRWPSRLMIFPRVWRIVCPRLTSPRMTAKLLGTLRDQKIPVVGFVNEKKLYKPGEVDERIKALQMWLDYGFELGNHTFSHVSLNQNRTQGLGG